MVSFVIGKNHEVGTIWICIQAAVQADEMLGYNNLICTRKSCTRNEHNYNKCK